MKTAIYILDSVTAVPALQPVPLPAPIPHTSTIDEFKANLDQEEAQIKGFIRHQREAGIEVDIPAAYGLPANMIPPPLRQQPQQNSSQFITSTPIPEGAEARPCGSNMKSEYCCLNKPCVTVEPMRLSE